MEQDNSSHIDSARNRLRDRVAQYEHSAAATALIDAIRSWTQTPVGRVSASVISADFEAIRGELKRMEERCIALYAKS